MKKTVTAVLILLGFLLSVCSVFAEDVKGEELYLTGLRQKIDSLNLSFAEIQRYAAHTAVTPEFQAFELALITNMYKNLYYLTSIVNLPNETLTSGSGEVIGKVASNTTVSNSVLYEYAQQAAEISRRFCTDYQLVERNTADGKIVDLIGIPLDSLREQESTTDGNGDTVTSYIELERDKKFVSVLKNVLSEQLTKAIPRIVLENLKVILNKTENSSNITGEVSRNLELLYWSGEVIDYINGFDNDFADLKEWNKQLSQNTWESIKNAISLDLTKLYTTQDSVMSRSDYERVTELINKARTMINSSGSTSDNMNWESRLPETIEYQIEALADVKKSSEVEDGVESVGAWEPADWDPASGESAKNFQLTSTYVSIVASSAIYRPFQSYVGDADFMEALKSLTSADELEDVTQLFNGLKDKRKPLYYMSSDTMQTSDNSADEAGSTTGSEAAVSIYGHSYNDVAGLAKRATLNDLILFAEEGKNMEYVTVRGEFKAALDTNSWAFYQSPIQAKGNLVKSSSSNSSTMIPAEDSVTGKNYTRVLFEIGDQPGT